MSNSNTGNTFIHVGNAAAQVVEKIRLGQLIDNSVEADLSTDDFKVLELKAVDPDPGPFLADKPFGPRANIKNKYELQFGNKKGKKP